MARKLSKNSLESIATPVLRSKIFTELVSTINQLKITNL